MKAMSTVNILETRICERTAWSYRCFCCFYFLDEILAPECRAGEFSCDNQCHSLSSRCDGIEDCSDGYDEENCDEHSTTMQPVHHQYPSSEKPPLQCPQYKCPGEEVCFGVSDRCNGRWECSDGYDESGCQRKRSPIHIQIWDASIRNILFAILQPQKPDALLMNSNVTIPFACQIPKNAIECVIVVMEAMKTTVPVSCLFP